MTYLHFFSGLRCAQCHHSASFELRHATPHRVRDTSDRTGLPIWRSSTDDFSGLFVCQNCVSPTLIQFRFRKDRAPELLPEGGAREPFLNRLNLTNVAPQKGGARAVWVRSDGEPAGMNLAEFCDIVASYPASNVEVPADLPADVARIWADDVANVGGSARMTVVACRSVLEMMLKSKQASGDNIVKMIASLSAAGVLTKDIAEWANFVRGLGNEAVHESKPVDAAVAREVYEFTRVIAEILFTYPARIQRLRAAS